MKRQSETLISLLDETGLQRSPLVHDFEGLAAAAQLQRQLIGSSDRVEITRSTALWALMAIDAEVEAALRWAGVDASALAGELNLTGVPSEVRREPSAPAYLDGQFTAAVRQYLDSIPPRQMVETRDLALAILHSARTDTESLIHQRLARLGIDYEVAIAALEASLPIPMGFSRTVRQIRDSLGADAFVTAGRIVAEIQEKHPFYGNGRLGQLIIDPEIGERLPFDKWLERVRQLYDPLEVASSPHEVIDGQLVTLGLAEFGVELRNQLMEGEFLDTMRNLVAVRPRRRPDQTGWWPDAPAKMDALGRQYLAQVLIAKLRNIGPTNDPDVSNSFIVHIDGPWGSGKSSLFSFLDKELRKPPSDANKTKKIKGPKKFLTVHVNAWREQQLGVQWWTLYRALRREIETEAYALGGEKWWGKKRCKAGAWLRGRWDVMTTRPGPFVSALLLVSIALLLTVVPEVWADVENLSKIMTFIVVGFTALTAAFRYIMPDSYRSAEKFVAKSKNPMLDVRKLFAKALGRSQGAVVFFIDDLDRCDPQYVIEFLEVVQNLVRDAVGELTRGGDDKNLMAGGDRQANNVWKKIRGGANELWVTLWRLPVKVFNKIFPDSEWARETFGGPYAFIAADGQWIRSCYEQHYSSVATTEVLGRPLGYLFLEKIFQLHVRLPVISEEVKADFYKSLLDGALTDKPSQEEEQLVQAVREKVDKAEDPSEMSMAAVGQIPENSRAQLIASGETAVRAAELSWSNSSLHELAPFAKFLDPNPRSIKLFVNSYAVSRSLRILENIHIDVIPLALWTIVEIRWPLLADHLRINPDHIQYASGHCDTISPNFPSDIRGLLENKEVKSVIVSSGWGRLTPKHVRECTGFRVLDDSV